MNTKLTGIISLLTIISGTVFGDFQTSFTVARKAVSQKQYELAIKNYQEAAKQTTNPGQKYQALLGIAETYRVKADWKNAEKILVQILNDKTIPARNRMSAQIMLGDYKLKQKKTAEATAAYQKAASYGTQNNEFYYSQLSCGNLLAQQKKYDEAKKCYQALINDPKVDANRKIRAQIGLGNVLYEQGKYQDAVNTLKNIADDPKVQPSVRADALIVTARSQYKMKAYKDSYKTNLSIIDLKNIPNYFKVSAYMQAIAIQESCLNDYAQAKKLLDDFEKMPGLTASQKNWITSYRAKIKKAEHTL